MNILNLIHPINKPRMIQHLQPQNKVAEEKHISLAKIAYQHPGPLIITRQSHPVQIRRDSLEIKPVLSTGNSLKPKPLHSTTPPRGITPYTHTPYTHTSQ